MSQIEKAILYIINGSSLEFWVFLFLFLLLIVIIVTIYAKKYILSSKNSKFKFLSYLSLGIIFGISLFVVESVLNSINKAQNFNNNQKHWVYSFYIFIWIFIILLVLITFGNFFIFLGFVFFLIIYLIFFSSNYLNILFYTHDQKLMSKYYLLIIISLLLFFFILSEILSKTFLKKIIKFEDSIRYLLIYIVYIISIFLIFSLIVNYSSLLNNLYWYLFINAFVLIIIVFLFLFKRYFSYQANYSENQKYVRPKILYNEFLISNVYSKKRSNKQNIYGIYGLLYNKLIGDYISAYSSISKKIINEFSSDENIYFFINKNGDFGYFCYSYDINNYAKFEKNIVKININNNTLIDKINLFLKNNELYSHNVIYGIHNVNFDSLDYIIYKNKSIHKINSNKYMKFIPFLDNIGIQTNNYNKVQVDNKLEIINNFFLYPVIYKKKNIGYIVYNSYDVLDMSISAISINIIHLIINHFNENNIKNKIIFIKIHHRIDINSAEIFINELFILFNIKNYKFCLLIEAVDEKYFFKVYKYIKILKDSKYETNNIIHGVYNLDFSSPNINKIFNTHPEYVFAKQYYNYEQNNIEWKYYNIIKYYCKLMDTKLIIDMYDLNNKEWKLLTYNMDSYTKNKILNLKEIV